MDQLLRVQNSTVSADGFGAGEQQSSERPFGHADPRSSAELDDRFHRDEIPRSGVVHDLVWRR